jgi:hypothetical protein
MSSARPVTAESGSPLGERRQVGLEAVVIHRPHPAGAAEAGLDLVGDEEDAVLPAELEEHLDVGGRSDDEAALSQHQLHHHTGDLLGRDVGGEELLDLAAKRRCVGGFSLGSCACCLSINPLNPLVCGVCGTPTDVFSTTCPNG